MAYGLNRIPNMTVHNTSFELWKCWKYNLKYGYALHCLAEVGINNPHEIKLDSRIVNGYFIGYAKQSKGCRFYYQSNVTRIVKSKNARFLKNDDFNESSQP